MNASVYSELARMGLQGSGQFIPANNIFLIEARLSSLMMREGYNSVGELLESLPMRSTSGLRREVVAEMCSGETWFFRDLANLNHIATQLVPAALNRTTNGRISIWCAAASTGQEVLSLIMLLADIPALASANIDILATDISAQRLRLAKEAKYDHFQAQRGLPIRYLLANFEKQNDNNWVANQDILRNVRFRQHNLLEPTNMLGKFDIVLCRNVFSSMAPDAQKTAVKNISAQVKPGGCIVVGENESLTKIDNSIVPSLTNKAVYERAGAMFENQAA